MTHPLLALCLLLLSSLATAADLSSVPAHPAFRLLESNTSLTPEQALQALQQIPQQNASTDGVTIGNRNTTYWLLTELRFDGDGPHLDQILRVRHLYPKFDRLELFLYADGQQVRHLFNGESIPYSQRPTPGLLMAFPLELKSGVNYQLLIAASGRLKQTLSFELESPVSFAASAGQSGINWGTFFSVFFLTAVLALIFLVVTRNLLYLYLSLLITSLALTQGSYTAYAYWLLWPEAPEWQKSAHLFFIGFSILCATLFSRRFLDTATHTPRLDYWIRCNGLLGSIAIVSALVLPYFPAAILNNLILLVSVIPVVLAAVICLRKGVKTARFFLFGWGANITMTLAHIAYLRGLLPYSDFIQLAPQLGCLVEVLSLVAAIADQLRIDQLDKQRALREQSRAIEALQHAEKELSQLAHQDPNTGLANRVILKDSIEHVLATRDDDLTPALVLLKLKGLREINNTLGHYVGDQVVHQTTCFLQEQLLRVPASNRIVLSTDNDEYLASMQGITFAFLLQTRTLAECEALVQQVQNGLPPHLILNDITLDLSTGAGLYRVCAGDDAERIIRNAFVAVERAQKNSKDLVIYSDDINPYNERRLSLISELRKAIETDQLAIYLQPQLDTHNMSIVSAEALIRWNHPKLGFIPPDEFIGLAENSGVIKPLTRWVITNAIKTIAFVHRRGHKIGLSINISPKNIEETDLTQHLVTELKRFGVAPQFVTLEITETAMLNNPALATQVLNQWNQIGLSTSIDDFGTGYSSLSHLKKLPMSELKIDRSFIMDMNNNDDDMMIVRSTLDISHNMRMRVVAEGVEDEKMLQILKNMGCDVIQGYTLSKPLAPEKFLEWLNQTNYQVGMYQTEQTRRMH
ncbi:MAG TPA: EAL domain-containing protein [Dongiaceae bacterium]|nr:EAL domain-containing protein [Dongiaceae bacterium]